MSSIHCLPRPLAVQQRHLGGGVAFAGHGTRRHRRLDAGESLASSLRSRAAERLGQPVAPAGADQGNDVLALGQHPGDGELATVALRSQATSRSASTSARLRSRLAPMNRGL